MKVVDLFCGAGGFSEGFRQAGFEVILGIDIWMDALKSFKYNQKCDVLKADIGSIEKLPNCDVIIGSPPCQNFSRINTKRNPVDGMKGIMDFERIIEINKPKYWIWENVEFIKKYIPTLFCSILLILGYRKKEKGHFLQIFLFSGQDTKGEKQPLFMVMMDIQIQMQKRGDIPDVPERYEQRESAIWKRTNSSRLKK